MPDVGEGLTEAEILQWHVAPGDPVHDGMVVCEIETAKASVELPIPFDGVVHEIAFGAGETVPVGAAIITVDAGPPAATVDTDPPALAEGTAPAPGERQPVLVGYGIAESGTQRRLRRRDVPQRTSALQADGGGRRLAKPPVRKLAKDLGVDLSAVIPTGPGQVVTREDIRGAAEAVVSPPPAGARVAPPAAAPAPAPGEHRLPIKGVRKATAAAMVASAFTAPHVTEFLTVDVTRTVKLVRELKQDPGLAGLRVNPLLLVARAFLTAVHRHPDINASWDEDRQEIVRKDAINLGIAAATPRGLLVPNIKRAQSLSFPQLSTEMEQLVTAAREGKTSPAALADGTVTLTNIGVFGVDTGTPILNPGESAILAFGAIARRPWVHKGTVKPRHVTTLALSFDHRLVDGELGSRVLADTAAVLEHPKRLITWA
ncbi:dihydrolipoamide acetyltransferase family protein [Streptomyces decoyicus]|uniref:dihydrolipoamide acetyltransferase family protein n=2 Tax=Streptomyces decoyicus TaxID=249567 RepID=UPI0033A7DB86